MKNLDEIMALGPLTVKRLEKERNSRVLTVPFSLVRTINFFLKGPKPCLFLTSIEYGYFKEYLKVYHVKEIIKDKYLISKNEIIREPIDSEGNLDHSLVGKLLGFPEKAIESFSRKECDFSLDYHGLMFTLKEEDLNLVLEELDMMYSDLNINQGVYVKIKKTKPDGRTVRTYKRIR